MDREEAIEYLEKKGKITGNTKYNKKEEEEIKTVTKKGKIYGDPVVEIY
jgi:hypothetical protein